MRKIFIVIIIIFLLLAFGLIYFYWPKEKVEKPKKVAVPSPQVPKVSPPTILYNLTGQIKKIEKNSIFFEALIPVLDEKGEPIQKSEVRKAIITTSTTFTKISFVEVEEKKKKIVENPIAFGDLKVGDYIEAISNQDISKAEEFEVTQIRVFPH